MDKDIKTYKPITPGLRHRIDVKSDNLWKGKPHKRLVKGKTKTGGRNNHGRITRRYIGGGHKKLYRDIDFQRKIGLYTSSIIERLEYDPNRSGNIALCKTKNGKYYYMLAPEGLEVGSEIQGRLSRSENFEIKKGTSLMLKDIPVGQSIYNVELEPGKGGQLGRSAGVYCILIENLDNGNTIIQLPSGKKITISSKCLASIGRVSNINHNKIILGKAGRKRWLGKRPKVRGEAMNPIDHPHGGKSHGPGGLNTQPRTKWGKLAKWIKTKKTTFSRSYRSARTN